MKAIFAVDSNGGFGYEGKIPWHVPEDLKMFSKYTQGKTIVMGRKTFDSIGRPLPNRKNIVVTRQKDWAFDGVQAVNDILDVEDGDDVILIGGVHLAEEAFRLGLVSEIRLTRIPLSCDTDVVFTMPADFEKTSTAEAYCEKSNIHFTVETWEKA